MDLYTNYKKVEAEYSVEINHICQYDYKIIINWLTNICMHYTLVDDVLFMSVNIFDRYVVKNEKETRLPLVAITALLIAYKFEIGYDDINIEKCRYLCDVRYSYNSIIDMQKLILLNVEFDINVPTSLKFLELYLSLTDTSEQIKTKATYYLKLSLKDVNMREYSNSIIASAAFYISDDENTCNDKLSIFTGCSSSDFYKCVRELKNIRKNIVEEMIKNMSY